MTTLFHNIPIELISKPVEFVITIHKINKELHNLKISIQLKMTITEHRKLVWSEAENYYWIDSVTAYNYLSVVDLPLGNFI